MDSSTSKAWTFTVRVSNALMMYEIMNNIIFLQGIEHMKN